MGLLRKIQEKLYGKSVADRAYSMEQDKKEFVPISKKTTPTKEKVTKEEMIHRLEEISKTEVPPMDERAHGAMCYSPAMPPERIIKCDKCGKEFIAYDDLLSSYERLKEFNYDMKLECLCGDCCEQPKDGIWWKSPRYDFYFRFNPEDEYHVAKSVHAYELDILYAFFDGKDRFTGSRQQDIFLQKHMYTIERLIPIEDA